MGLFSSKSPEDKAEARVSKARAKATKRGIEVGDATFVGWGTNKAGEDQCLVVYQGRVEWYGLGKAAALVRMAPTSQVIQGSKIASVSVGRDGIYGILTLGASGPDLVFTADQKTVAAAAQAVRAISG